MGDINKDGYEGEIVVALGGDGNPGSLLMLQQGILCSLSQTLL